jgi:hypothetical protein
MGRELVKKMLTKLGRCRLNKLVLRKKRLFGLPDGRIYFIQTVLFSNSGQKITYIKWPHYVTLISGIFLKFVVVKR